jgi:methyl-accepting chemotaxis protein
MFFASKTSSSDDQAVIAALNASQAVIEFTPKGQILTANSNFLNAVGYDLEEIRGRQHSLFCDPIYVQSEEYKSFWRSLEGGDFASNVFKRFARGGRVIWLQATYNPIRDTSGKVIKVIKFASDITEAKAREIDTSGKIDAINRAQAIIEFTTKGEIITANQNFLDAIGYSLNEIQGRRHNMFCEPEYVKSDTYRRFWEDLAAGKFQSAEYRRLGKGGREVYIQASYNPIFDDTGEVVKVVKFASDITEAVQRRLRNEKLNQSLGGVIDQISAANSMATNAAEASSETDSMIHSVAAASEELSQSVKEVAYSMTMAKTGVEDVFRHTEEVTVSAQALNDSAAAMNNVVSLIQEIASQINLLALNATIESARAGEAGRGFAVVASEVKSLANQAARSTETISSEITKMQSVTNTVVGSLGMISHSMNTVLENVTSIAGTLEEQTAVTSEISNNMQSAVGAVRQINDSLAEISTTFTQVAEASEEVKQEMDRLVA